MRRRDRCESRKANDDSLSLRRTTSGMARSLCSDALTLAQIQSLAYTHTAINPPANADRSHHVPLAPLGHESARKNHSPPAFPLPPSPCAPDEALSPDHQCNAVPSTAEDVLPCADAPLSSPEHLLLHCCPCLFIQLHPHNQSILFGGCTKKVTASERSASQIYRVTQRLGASRRACPERSRRNPESAYPTHAVRTLSTTEARTWRTCHGLSPGPRTS